uniref:NACHT domain-containing protein n=1 Tax=Aplanochytrium stocchinoi TaxID=215587 RepID=A0A7S3LJ52_9STRA
MLKTKRKVGKTVDVGEAASAGEVTGEGAAVAEYTVAEGLSHGVKYFRPVLANRREYVPGTLDWTINYIKGWYTSGSSKNDDERWSRILHIEGKQGTGKTMLLAQLADRGHKQGIAVRDKNMNKDAVKVGAVYFFSRLNRRVNDVKTFVRAISDQLRDSVPGFIKALKAQTAMDEFFLRKLDVMQLFDKLIIRPLKSDIVKKKQKRTVILIDALDECKPQYFEPLLQVMETWDAHTPEWLGVIITSVQGGYVSRKMKALDRTGVARSMSISDKKYTNQVKEDLSVVVKRLLKDKIEQKDLGLAIDVILSKSEMRFLYVKFLERLCDIVGYDVEALKNKLPKGLPSAYAEIFKDLYKKKMGGNKEDYKNTLGPLVATRIPLDIQIWRECCGQDEEFRMRVKDDMGSLINLYQTEGKMRVSFSHLTIRHWLCNEALVYDVGQEVFSARSQKGTKKLAVKRTVGHALLANYCWEKYQRRISEGTPPDFYAMNHIIYHLMNTKRGPDGRPSRAADAANLLKNFDWNLQRISLKGAKDSRFQNISFALIDAFDVYLKEIPDDRPVRIIQSAIDKSRAALARDPRQLAAQILARVSETSCIGDTQLAQFMEEAKLYNPGDNVQWWRPVTHTLRRVDVSQVERLFLFEKFKKSVVCVKVSPHSGSVAAAAGFDGRVKIFETKRGRNLFTFNAHKRNKGKVLSLSFSYGRNSELLLCTGGSDGFIILWNADNGKMIFKKKVGRNHVACLALRPEEKNLTWGQSGESSTETGDDFGTTSAVSESEVENSRRQSIIAVCGRDGLRIFHDDEQQGGLIMFSNQKMDCTAVEWSRTQRNVLAVATASGYAFIYDTKLKTTTQTLTHGQRVNDISFHPVKNWILTAGEDTAGVNSSKVILWDYESGNILNMFDKVHKSGILSVDFSQRGKHFACGGDDGSISIVQTENWGESWENVRNEWIIGNSGRNKADIEEFNEQDYLQLDESLPDTKMRFENGHTSSVLSLSYFPKSNRIISCSKDRSVIFWSYNPKDLEDRNAIQHDEKIILAMFSPDGSMLATAGKDKKVIVWETATGKAQRMLYDSTKVSTLRWSPDGANVGFTIVSGIEIWKNAQTGFDAPAPEMKVVIEAAAKIQNPGKMGDAAKKIEESPLAQFITQTPDENGVGFTSDTARERPLRFCNLSKLEEDAYTNEVYAAVCEDKKVHILQLVTNKPVMKEETAENDVTE